MFVSLCIFDHVCRTNSCPIQWHTEYRIAQSRSIPITKMALEPQSRKRARESSHHDDEFNVIPQAHRSMTLSDTDEHNLIKSILDIDHLNSILITDDDPKSHQLANRLHTLNCGHYGKLFYYMIFSLAQLKSKFGNIEPCEEHAQFFDALMDKDRHRVILLTGVPGAGKSTAVEIAQACLNIILDPSNLYDDIKNEIIKEPTKTKKSSSLHVFGPRGSLDNRIVITATTGAAAERLENASTIHSLITLVKDRQLDNLGSVLIKTHLRQGVIEKLRTIEFLFIDEVSMMTLAMFDNIYASFNIAWDMPFETVPSHHTSPFSIRFGKLKKLILIGDFFQLPPVSPFTTNKNQIGRERCFHSPIFQKMCGLKPHDLTDGIDTSLRLGSNISSGPNTYPMTIMNLQKNFRISKVNEENQDGNQFSLLLRAIRDADTDALSRGNIAQSIESRIFSTYDEFLKVYKDKNTTTDQTTTLQPIALFFQKNQVDIFNNKVMDEIDGVDFVYCSNFFYTDYTLKQLQSKLKPLPLEIPVTVIRKDTQEDKTVELQSRHMASDLSSLGLAATTMTWSNALFKTGQNHTSRFSDVSTEVVSGGESDDFQVLTYEGGDRMIPLWAPNTNESGHIKLLERCIASKPWRRGTIITRLKIGIRVSFTFNISQDIYNGTDGEVVGFVPLHHFLMFKTAKMSTCGSYAIAKPHNSDGYLKFRNGILNDDVEEIGITEELSDSVDEDVTNRIENVSKEAPIVPQLSKTISDEILKRMSKSHCHMTRQILRDHMPDNNFNRPHVVGAHVQQYSGGHQTREMEGRLEYFPIVRIIKNGQPSSNNNTTTSGRKRNKCKTNTYVLVMPRLVAFTPSDSKQDIVRGGKRQNNRIRDGVSIDAQLANTRAEMMHDQREEIREYSKQQKYATRQPTNVSSLWGPTYGVNDRTNAQSRYQQKTDAIHAARRQADSTNDNTTMNFYCLTMPLVPSAARTIHSVQGLTLDAAYIDIGNGESASVSNFQPGMFYVAASRVKNMNHIAWSSNPIHAINTSETVKNFDSWGIRRKQDTLQISTGEYDEESTADLLDPNTMF